MRSTLLTIAGLGFFVAAGLLLERNSTFAVARLHMQGDTIPTDMLNYGAMGKVLKRIGVVRPVHNDESQFHRSKTEEVDIGDNMFQKKRHVGRYLFKTNPGGIIDMASSSAVPPEEIEKGYPIISIYVAPDDLHGEKRGIIHNAQGRGRKWERLSQVSYFDKGELLFASGAGLRLHGRFSRRPDKNEGNPFRNFRLYFRRKYGTRQFNSGNPFSLETDPIKTLVLKRDRYWLFVDALTLDIARQLGCIAPEVKQAVFFLNGKSQGVYGLMEHVSKRQWKAHVGHDDFIYFRYKSDNKKKAVKAYDELEDWAKDRRIKMTMAEAGRHINLDNYTRHMISFIFCGDSDWRQGVAVLDEREPYPKWYWINWDMDHSFKDFKKTSKSGKRWEQQAIDLILKKRGDVRATIFRRLRNDSPEFGAYFARMTTDLFNHRIDPEYLNTRLDTYRQLAETFGRDNQTSIDKLREYVNNRPDYIRRQTKVIFEAGDFFYCSVKGPPGTAFEIDGYPEDYDYNGWYFQQQTVTVRIVGPRADQFSHWLVNGNRVDTVPLVHHIIANTTIEPVFKQPL